MPYEISKVATSVANIKSIIVSLSDDDKSLQFQAEVTRPIGSGDRGSVTVPVSLSLAEVDILLRLAKG